MVNSLDNSLSYAGHLADIWSFSCEEGVVCQKTKTAQRRFFCGPTAGLTQNSAELFARKNVTCKNVAGKKIDPTISSIEQAIEQGELQEAFALIEQLKQSAAQKAQLQKIFSQAKTLNDYTNIFDAAQILKEEKGYISSVYTMFCPLFFQAIVKQIKAYRDRDMDGYLQLGYQVALELALEEESSPPEILAFKALCLFQWKDAYVMGNKIAIIRDKDAFFRKMMQKASGNSEVKWAQRAFDQIRYKQKSDTRWMANLKKKQVKEDFKEDFIDFVLSCASFIVYVVAFIAVLSFVTFLNNHDRPNLQDCFDAWLLLP